MQEIPELRAYNRRVFSGDDGKTLVRIFAGQQFYDNKLGVGDGVRGWRDIDNTLSWIEEPRRGWTFLFHSYQPFVPEFADEWFGYRDLYQGKDQIFAFRPRQAQHVAGRLVQNIPGVTEQNAVIYDDAFGTGIDLIIKFTFRKMVKLIRIRNGFYPAADTDFDFELRLPEGAGFFQKDLGTGEMLSIDPTQPVALRARAQLYIGNDLADGRDWYTRVMPVRIWDSGQFGNGTGMKVNLAPAAIAIVNGRPFLRKRVLASFFSNAVGDVYTDATVTYSEDKDTYYGTVFTTGGAPNSDTLNTGGWGDLYHSYIEWDLTSSPAAALVSDAKVYCKIKSKGGNNPNDVIRRVTSSWTEAGITSSSVPTDTTTAQVDVTSWYSGGTVDVFSNASILTFYQGWKNGTFSNFGIKIHTTVGSNNNGLGLYSSDNAAGDQPYLELTLLDEVYTRGAQSSVPTNTTDLATTYSGGEITNVGTDDGTRVGISGAPVVLHLYKKLHTNNTDQIAISWNGRASIAPSSKQVKLQIYNFNTPAWEDLDSDNATAAATDFDLSGSKTSNLSHYYSPDLYVFVRVYQDLS